MFIQTVIYNNYYYLLKIKKLSRGEHGKSIVEPNKDVYIYCYKNQVAR